MIPTGYGMAAGLPFWSILQAAIRIGHLPSALSQPAAPCHGATLPAICGWPHTADHRQPLSAATGPSGFRDLHYWYISFLLLVIYKIKVDYSGDIVGKMNAHYIYVLCHRQSCSVVPLQHLALFSKKPAKIVKIQPISAAIAVWHALCYLHGVKENTDET